MIAPPNLRCLGERLTWVLGGLVLWVLALVAVPVALAGDQREPDTDIVTGPPDPTSSTTADFTFTSTATRAAFFCRLDGDELTEYVPCETPWHVEGLELGYHSLLVYSVNLDNGYVDPEADIWEWEVVPGEPPLDAGTLDGGASSGDAGPGDLDGGPSGNDGGGGPADAGPGDTDGGTSGSDGGSSGSDGGASGSDGGASGSDGGASGGDGGASGSDAGSPGSDGGTSGSDGGGPSGSDGGASGSDGGASSSEDAGTPGDDAGTPDGDAGDGPTGPPPSDGDVPADSLDYLGGGVGCTGAPAPGAVAGLLLLALALRRRRRP